MLPSGRMAADVECRVAKASKAFVALRKAVFLDWNLFLRTKRKVYQACVLSVLLYGAECWILLRRQVKQLNTFHHRCIRSILGISNMQQWDERITMADVRERWGDEELVDEKIEVGVARSPGSHAGSLPPKECAVWLAASTSSLERATQEITWAP